MAFFVITFAAYASAPSGLLCNHRRHPAVGVATALPHFSWVVPHVEGCGTDQMQVAHQIQLVAAPRGALDHTSRVVLWDSGRTESVESIAVRPIAAVALEPTTRYHWRVRSWTTGAAGASECASIYSDWAEVMTAPYLGFAASTLPIWAPNAKALYTFHRLVVPAPASPITGATAFVSALQDTAEKLLGAYRLQIEGEALAIGPGRGDVATSAGNHTPYDSMDVTHAVVAAKGAFAVGLQCFSRSNGAVLLEMHLEHADGSTSVVATNNASGWASFDATAAYAPASVEGGYGAPQEEN